MIKNNIKEFFKFFSSCFKSWWWILLFIVAVIGINYAVYIWRNDTICNFKNCKDTVDSVATWGQTGDFFGGILNPFFTLLGLIFVGITIRQSQKALEHSIDTARKERFEASFFQLISLFNEAAVSSKIHEPNERANGRPNGLQIYLSLFDSSTKDYQKIKDIEDIEDIKKELDKRYDQLKFGSNLGGFNLDRYFRSLYNIIIFADNNELLNNDKKSKNFYTNLIYAQLTHYEIGLLFYSSLCKGDGEFFRLVENWGFFEYLNEYEIHPPLNHYALKLDEHKMKKYKTFREYYTSQTR